MCGQGDVHVIHDWRAKGVTIDEMTDALQRLGLPLPRKEVLIFFSLYDADGSGEIDYSEFVNRMYPDE